MLLLLNDLIDENILHHLKVVAVVLVVIICKNQL